VVLLKDCITKHLHHQPNDELKKEIEIIVKAWFKTYNELKEERLKVISYQEIISKNLKALSDAINNIQNFTNNELKQKNNRIKELEDKLFH
jgi:hypothetical protein